MVLLSWIYKALLQLSQGSEKLILKLGLEPKTPNSFSKDLSNVTCQAFNKFLLVI